jgi:hypothetical protein
MASMVQKPSPSQPAAARAAGPAKGWKRALLNVFIALHVAALFFWGLPDSGFRNLMARPFQDYVVFTGLWHIWGMFAPNPLNINFDVRAQVKYRDGSVAEWHAPRMEEFSVWQRAPKERFRKWRERIRSPEYAMVLDDTAQYIARQCDTKPGNPPVEVKLTRYWLYVPPPAGKADFQPVPNSYNLTNSFTFATRKINPERLQ